jgi:hypothetical protein
MSAIRPDIVAGPIERKCSSSSGSVDDDGGVPEGDAACERDQSQAVTEPRAH